MMGLKGLRGITGGRGARKWPYLVWGATLPFAHAEAQGDHENWMLTEDNETVLGLDFSRVSRKFREIRPEQENWDIFFINPYIENRKIKITDLDGITLRVPWNEVSLSSPKNYMEMNE